MGDDEIDNSSEMGNALEQMLIDASGSSDLENGDRSDVVSQQCQESLSAGHEQNSEQTTNDIGLHPLLSAGELGENPDSPIKYIESRLQRSNSRF